MKPLETERLILRAWDEEDAEAMYAYARKPSIGPAAGWKPHASLEESREIIKGFIADDDVWAVTMRADGRLIGSFGLHRDIRRVGGVKAMEIGYVLAEEAWGRGYATEAARRVIRFAFEELRLDVLSVRHYPFNARSRRVIEKCGFQYEGTLRHASLRYDGVLLDSCFYSMLKEEYPAAKAAWK